MSLQDIDDLDSAIHEISRILTPGGTLCLAIVHPLDGLPMTFESAHRPLGRYFQTLEAAGLHVVALRESAVPGSAVAANPAE
jgi:ubiquinone/menaquinone biosynthesis C-methylase UbiE